MQHLTSRASQAGRRVSLSPAARRALASQPPLTVEMPGTPKLQPASQKPRPKTQLTTLPNGLRVVSEENFASASSVGLFVDAGSRFETDDNNGVSHLMEQMAFKSTSERSHQRIVRDVEDMGAVVGAVSAREYMLYSADILRPNVDKAVQLIAETVTKPRFAPWDIEEQRAVMEIELAELEKNAQGMTTQLLYSAAYSDASPLGRPLFCPARNLHRLGAAELTKFHAEHYKVNRMVLAGAGVDHDELVNLAKQHFGGLAAGAPTPKLPATKYVGGEQRLRCESPLTQVAICFDSGGWNSEQLLPMCVLHMLLGGGSSFSAGGPGKGIMTRLYHNILNKHHWVDSATAFNCMHNDAGLIGVYGTAEPKDCGRLVDVIASELLDVATKAPSEEETRRAKAQLKSSVFMNLEARQVLMEDLARQILVFGKREDPVSLCARIDAVTPNDVLKAAKKALSSPVTLAAFGDVSHVPSYAEVASRFRL